MALPDGCDIDKLAEVALALMFPTIHDGGVGPRAWKGFDWDILNLLHEKGWISDPRGKAKSVMLSEESEQLAERFFKQYFEQPG